MTDGTNDRHEGAIEQRLVAERPLPRAGFRARLRTHLLASLRTGEAPVRLRLLIAAYAGSGAVLLLVAAVGVAGAGPLAA